MKESIIDTYYNEIYEIYLVVANEKVTLEELQELYVYSDGVELDNAILTGDCTTSTCYRKEDNASVCLIKFNKYSKRKGVNRRLELVNICSHEGTHVALDIYERISQNVCFCSSEPFCYLQGWAAENIYNTLSKK